MARPIARTAAAAAADLINKLRFSSSLEPPLCLETLQTPSNGLNGLKFKRLSSKENCVDKSIQFEVVLTRICLRSWWSWSGR